MWFNEYLKKHPLIEKFEEDPSSIAHLSVNQEALLYLGSVFRYGKN